VLFFMETEIEDFKYQRFVIKLGSSVIVDSDDDAKLEVFDSVARQTSRLIDHGYEIAIVTSGAVAFGRKRLGFDNGNLVRKQELAAAGSTRLFTTWAEAFKRYGKITIDHLLSEQDVQAISVGSPKWPLLDELQSGRYVPIINANDSVNTFELEQLSVSADNDQLSAFVARLVQAGKLIMLTEAEGVWDQNRQVIKVIEKQKDLEQVYTSSKTDQGTGGIESKIEVAVSFAIVGKSVWITNCENDSILRIARDEQVGTKFRMS